MMLLSWGKGIKNMPEMKEVTPERFACILDKHKTEDYHLLLKGWQVPILHGLIALAADHPGIQELGSPTHGAIKIIRGWCKWVFSRWGFTPEEVEYLDKMREEYKDHA